MALYITVESRGRRGEATAERHETGQQGHRARHRQPAPGSVRGIPAQHPLHLPGIARRRGKHYRSWGNCAP